MKLRAVLFALLGTTLSLHAAPQASPAPSSDFSHTVPVQIGKTTLLAGDEIVIDAIHGSADTISAGNVYRVDGHYTLGSHPEGQLAINVTNGVGDSHVAGQSKDVIVQQGNGIFTLYFRMNQGGDAHMSFYPSEHGGDSFASVYFNPVDTWAMQGAARGHVTDTVSH